MQILDTLVLNRDMQPVSLLPVSTSSWENAIKAIYTGAATIVHEYEDWEVHSPSTTFKVPSVVMIREYVNFSKEIPWNPEYLYLRDRYRCQYCRKGFPSHKLTQDHVTPRKYGGKTTWDNIVSACAPCNHSRGHNQKIRPMVEPYKPTYWELIEKAKQEITLVVQDESWLPYLGWPEDKILIKGKQKKILQYSRAA